MHEERGIILPESIRKGDTIAIISPASAVKEEYVEGAATRFLERGYEPVVMPHVLHQIKGSYSSGQDERLEDLREALDDPGVRAVFCARGGYGCVQLLSYFSYDSIRRDPKWIIGFSDVSALLALWYKSGVASVHGPMAKHLATMPPDDPCTNALFNVLENGGRFDYLFPAHPFNRRGKTKGVIRGGNFAVLNGLAATPYDILDITNDEKDIILFFEDISEPIYAIERMLWRLKLSGTLNKVKGIIFGQFTEYHPDKNFATMDDMIDYWISRWNLPPGIPVVFGFPVGHVDLNYPLTVGATVELEVNSDGVRIHTI